MSAKPVLCIGGDMHGATYTFNNSQAYCVYLEKPVEPDNSIHYLNRPLDPVPSFARRQQLYVLQTYPLSNLQQVQLLVCQSGDRAETSWQVRKHITELESAIRLARRF